MTSVHRTQIKRNERATLVGCNSRRDKSSSCRKSQSYLRDRANRELPTSECASRVSRVYFGDAPRRSEVPRLRIEEIPRGRETEPTCVLFVITIIASRDTRIFMSRDKRSAGNDTETQLKKVELLKDDNASRLLMSNDRSP